MDKKLIDAGQLIAILNQRLRALADTQGCRVTAVSPLQGAGTGMPNWSSNVSFVTTGVPRDRAMPTIRRVASMVQREYNLASPNKA